ncbi:ABC transporter permease [Amphibiibacter pelophylacis]|uniref:Ribose ABC transporter permease n=1 Tax=Amphibiibacter pelophylacis TaxID=1799477 RepID=A0ACC6P367_9BURK
MFTENQRLLLQRFAPLIALVLLCVALTGLSPDFMTVGNWLNVLRQVSVNALIACGMTLVILLGGIDLSVGAILGLSSIVVGLMIQSGMDPMLATALGVLCGGLLGAFNGVLVTAGRVAPFIATLGTMTVLRGVSLVLSNGSPVTGLSSPFFDSLGGGYLFGVVPTPVLWLVLVFAVFIFVLRKTLLGRHIYACGGNEQAARLSGVRVTRVKIWVYTLSGVLSAWAGIVLTSRLGSAQPTAGSGYELDAIAAVVLGGTSLSGGRGWVIGTLIGALLIGVLNNGLNLLGVPAFYQQVIKGAVILLAVLADRRSK